MGGKRRERAEEEGERWGKEMERGGKHSIPCHDVISDWGGRDAGWRICLHALWKNEGSVGVDTESPDMLKCFVSSGPGCRTHLKVTHKTSTSSSRHDGGSVVIAKSEEWQVGVGSALSAWRSELGGDVEWDGVTAGLESMILST